MKDIPVFTTDNGVASLAFQQIPYTGTAHITIRSTEAFDAFLAECVGFCCAVGAERILACGHIALDAYPVYTKVLKMQMPMPDQTDLACLFPVTDKSFDMWLDIYNHAMKNVPNAVILSRQMGKEIVNQGAAYFVHDKGLVLGIGIADGDTIHGIASCQKGAGEMVMKSLCGALNGDIVKVEVAENNTPAMNLYHRMGFIVTDVVKVWYDVTK